MKIVLNKCYGGFSISKKCAERMAELGCEHAKAELKEAEETGRFYGYGYGDNLPEYDRSNPYLVQAVEELGKEANGESASLEVVDVPSGNYEIDEYDGIESACAPRTWYG